MAELAKLIVDLLAMLWPFRTVWAWQRGVYFVFGRAAFEVGPGLKLVVPYFFDVRTVNVVPEVYQTALHGVALRDGTTLSFSAAVTVEVRNATAAYTKLGHWAETAIEIAAGTLADSLADADPERFDPARGKRGRLIEEFREAINKDLEPYGLVVTTLRLTNFMPKVRTYRIITDRAVLTSVGAFVPSSLIRGEP